MLDMKLEAIQRSKSDRKKNPIGTYNDYKEFQGMKYTGMKVGRSHKWYYDKGSGKRKGNP